MAKARKKMVPAQGSVWLTPGICFFLAAITFAVFGRTLGYGFVSYDDDAYVYDNPIVSQGLTARGFVWAFSSHAYNWHPLTWLSHMLDCQLYGLHPAGHHFTNVLLQAATAIALFLALRQMTGALWRSAFVAAVFAVHPLRVESVAWVAERKDVLSGLFFMLTIAAYARFAARPSTARYTAVVLLSALGLMCKPMLVTLPFVLLLLDFWPLQRKESVPRLLLEKLPLLALSAAAGVATLLAQTKVIHWTESIPLPMRVCNALVACMIYLWQMIYPAGLAVYYPLPHGGPPLWETGLAGILVAAISVIAVWQRRNRPWLLAGWLWYLVMLLPVLGIIQVGRQSHADRYTYLPQIGIYLAVTWLAASWRLSRATFGALMSGIIVVLMACAWKQAGWWKDSETLWTRALACTANNDVANFNLANVLCQEGRLDEGMAHYETALKIEPDYAAADVNLGNVLLQTGQMEEAISHFQSALQINPEYAEARNNLGNAFLRAGRIDDAIEQLQKASELKPGYAAAENDLATAFMQKGDHRSGLAHFEKALQFAPDTMTMQANLAWALATLPEAALRDGPRAVSLAARANELSGGNNPLVLRTLAAAQAEAGRFPEAVETAQRALQLALADSNQALAAQLQEQLKLYQVGQPFHGR